MTSTAMDDRRSVVQGIIDLFGGSQRKMADAIGVHQTTIHLWFSNGDIPPERHQGIMDVSKERATRPITHADFIGLPSAEIYRPLVQAQTNDAEVAND